MRSGLEDQLAVAQVRTGSDAAFTAIFSAFHEDLCRYAERLLCSPEAGKEIVSDVFAWIWENHAQWRVNGSLAAYLYRAVRNGCLDCLKHERTASRVHTAVSLLEMSPGMGERAATPEEALHAHELAQIVDRTLAPLPARPREAFCLQRQHGLTYGEIADVMGISTSTVEKHMVRALQALREALSGWVQDD